MKDIYICAYARTPIGAFQGTLSRIPATKLGSHVIKSTIDKSGINKKFIDEVIMGNVLSSNLGQAPARQSCLGAGLDNNVECMTINKVCGSGLKAVMLASQSIITNASDVIIAGGMENMSLAPYFVENARNGIMYGNSQLIDSILKDGLWDPYNDFAMGHCGEKLSTEKKYSRKSQDEFAIESYKRSNHAIKTGLFKEEIDPVLIKNKKGDYFFEIDEEPLKFNKDKLINLKPAFKKEGVITAGNASSLSDGAASVLVCSGDRIDEFGLTPIAKIVNYASYAMEPVYFTKAPIYAIKKVLENTKMHIDDIDLFEINEAFSCVPMVAMDELNISHDKLNVNGGAVSLGHPIGASGTRILVTLINSLKNKKLKYGIASLCIGGGEASAMIVEMCN